MTSVDSVTAAGKSPLVLDIKGNSLDDGPGIRSVIFFKGCPLDCLWCQNPESKSPKAELLWDREKCTGCRTCIGICREKAISNNIKKNPFFIDREKCSLCFACADQCPSGALSRAGQYMEVDEIVKEVSRYRDFFESSGGGVTLSGGEPTLYMEFSSRLLKKLKEKKIHTLIETCGQFNYERFSRLLLPWIDEIYFDIKLIDSRAHERYCGTSNETILNNFIRLHSKAVNEAFTIFPRTPMIPGITDGENDITLLAEFYREHGVSRAGLMANNPVWIDKLPKLGINDPFKDDDQIRNFYENDRKDEIKNIFHKFGIDPIFV